MGSVNTIDKFGRRKKVGKPILLRGPAGPGFKLTADGNYDLENKRLINVCGPKDSKDCVTLGYLKAELISVDEDLLKYIEQRIELLEQKITSILAAIGGHGK